MSASEWIGFGVGVCLMGLLVSSLLVISGRSAGVPRSKVVRAMLTIWGAMAACVAGLLFVRQQTGGDLINYTPGAEGLSVKPVPAMGVAWLAAGAIWGVACLLIASRAARGVMQTPRGTHTETDPDRE